MSTNNPPSYGIRDMSEIVIRSGGNTYVGELAQRFLTELKLPKLFFLDATEQFHVLEVMPDNSVIHRASQSTFRLAASYMTPDRVMVYRGGGDEGVLTATQRQTVIACGWEPVAVPYPGESWWTHRDGEGECVIESDLCEKMNFTSKPNP